jgi:hypothetical protein
MRFDEAATGRHHQRVALKAPENMRPSRGRTFFLRTAFYKDATPPESGGNVSAIPSALPETDRRYTRKHRGDRYDSVGVHSTRGLQTFSQTESSARSKIFSLRIHNSVSGKISFAHFFLGKKWAQGIIRRRATQRVRAKRT